MGFQEFAENFDERGHIGTVDKKVLIGLAAVVALVVIFVAYSVFNSSEGAFSYETDQVGSVQLSDTGSSSEEGGSAEPVKICVYVSGCVISPDICYLEEGSRVADAISECGGFAEDASPDSINLARVLVDGEQIDVPSIHDEVNVQEDQTAPSGQASSSVSSGISAGKVNLNTATSQELQTLSGIGQSKADKIIAYREANGPFKSIEELTEVSGIGEKTFESLKDAICI